MTETQLKEYVNNNAKKIIEVIENMKQNAKELKHFASVTLDVYDAEAYIAKAEAYNTALSLLFGIDEDD